MNTWSRIFRACNPLAAILVGAALLPALAGCTAEDTVLGRAVSAAIGLDSYPLSGEGRRELGRFRTVFYAYAWEDGGDDGLDHFTEAFKRVRAKYVREVGDAVLIDAAIKGVRDLNPALRSLPPGELVEAALDAMLVSLDPHSVYLNAEEFWEMMISTSGEFGGLGIEITLDDGLVKVISPIENTPAHRAGIKPGDAITHLDGVSIKDLPLIQAAMRMRGRPGTDIRLTVRRAGHPPFDVTITRAIIRVQPVRWRVEGDVGVVRVARFTKNMEESLLKAMRDIRGKLGPRLKGVVLDLRNNPGGLFDQSVVLADAFLDHGTVVSVRGREATAGDTYEATAGDLARGLPMVVLINGGSASASEIVAVALQDHGRATVMGARSFGKGTVQTIMPLPHDGALRITTALYFSPSGRAVQARGVEPDIAIGAAEASDLRRESDLPGALPGGAAAKARPRAEVDETDCPPAAAKDDRQMGCALALLRAGSPEKFLASVGAPM